MFGKNKIVRARYDEPTVLHVKSVFYTLQGEGPYTGQPALFVRLAGCNLKCWFCDTDFDNGEPTDWQILAARVYAQARLNKCNLVVLTGGEPMIQPISPLCRLLLDFGLRVQIETSGSVCAPDLPWEHVSFSVVCSPKTGSVSIDMVNAAAWKYVVQAGGVSEKDGLPVTSYQIQGKNVMLARPLNNSPVYITPMDEYNTDRNTVNMALVGRLCMEHGYTANIQLHKILGIE